MISGVVTYLGDVPEIEEVVYLSGCGQHACGDVVIDLYGGLGHDVSQWLHILVKVLQLLVDHGAKDALDLAGLKWRYARVGNDCLIVQPFLCILPEGRSC